MVLTVAKFFHWTDRYVLDMPVRRFWSCLDYIEEVRKANKENPFVAME